jgi:hypothetical protein
MARSGWSTANFLRTGGTPVTAVPCTLACWASVPSHSSQVNLFGIYNSADTTGNRNQFALLLTTGAQVGARTSGASGGNTAMTSTTFADGVSFHACGVFAGATDRRAYLNGGGKATNISGNTPSGLNRISVGCQDQNAPSSAIPSGSIAGEFAIWNVALTDPDVLMLAQGIPAYMVKPASLVFYAPGLGQYGPEIDIVGKRDLAIQGSLVAANHPPVRYTARSSRGAFHSIPLISVSLSGLSGSSTPGALATTGVLATSALRTLTGVVGIGAGGTITPQALLALLGVQGAAAIGALVADTATRINLSGVQGTSATASMVAAVQLLLSGNGTVGDIGLLAEEIAMALIGLAAGAGIGDPTVTDNWRRLAPSPASWTPETSGIAAWAPVSDGTPSWTDA